MRYALISDIHSNLEAFEAVIEALSKDDIDDYLCIGDVVGYGADPSACIRLVKSLKPKVLIAGNHEWGILGLTSLEYFNEMAEAAIIWTRKVLNREEIDYLKCFRLVYEDSHLTLVHGTLDSPKEFHYILSGSDAYQTICLMKNNFCFVGHSHVPGIFFSDGERITFTRGPKVKIESDKKYVVNVGSIGQPRDLDPRASYVIFDDEEGSLEIRRVGYNIENAKMKILKSGLPERLAYRLSEGR